LKSLNIFASHLSPRSWRIAATCAALFCHGIAAQAATRTWEDTGSDFATGGNWVGGAAPANSTATDIASFDAVLNFQPVLAANRSIRGLVFTTLSTAGVTFSGAGTLTLGSSGITNQSTSGTKLISTNLALGAALSFTNSGDLTIAGNINNSNRTLTINGAGDTTLSGVIGNGSGGISKLGAGTLTLTGANSYKGGTNITSGVVNIQNNTALGTSGGGTSVTAGAALQLQNGVTVTGETLTLRGTGIANDGALRNLFGNNTWAGALALGSNPGATIQSDAGLLTISGPITGNARTLTVNGDGDTTLSGTIATTSGGITKNDNGTLTMTGTNTFTGATTINGGTVSIATDRGLGNGPGGATADKIVFNGGTLATTNTFTLSANRGTTLNATGGTFDTAASTILTYNGIIAGTGGLTKSNTGTVVLGGANTYSGATTLNVGVLSINADNRLGVAPGSVTGDQLIFNGGTLATTASMALSANRSVALNAGGGTFDVATGTILNFSSTLSGAGTLTKIGAGTFELGATTTMAGEFALGAGTFALHGFDFTAGTLHITGNTILDFGNSAASILSLTDLVIDSGAFLTINNWVDAVDFFRVVNDPGSTAIGQITFTGGTYTSADTKWLSYDHQVTPAPEPATYGAILAGASTLLLAWSRRRRA